MCDILMSDFLFVVFFLALVFLSLPHKTSDVKYTFSQKALNNCVLIDVSTCVITYFVTDKGDFVSFLILRKIKINVQFFSTDIPRQIEMVERSCGSYRSQQSVHATFPQSLS